MTWDSSSGREKVVQKGDKFRDIQCQSGQSVIYQLCVKLGAQGWPAFNKPLHTPMYFFICSLAMVDIVYTSGISVTMLNVLLATWAVGCMLASLLTGLVNNLPFCGSNKLQYSFCEYAALVRAACVNPTYYFNAISAVGTAILWVNLALIIFSYMKIVYVVIHMSSSKDRRKTFNTCVSHMIVVACFFIPKVLLMRFEGG
ncbi:putative olfactory receptor 2B8 [Salvelinus alpinus]|uniref:putative olfactory receptor 2B8 n=1 Tax=Salvelinus alpinus TaxID=8036 RepID=UPI0039FD111C